MFLCIYYLYFSWFSRKLLFAIARYSLRYNLLVLGKNTPLFKTLVARKKKPLAYQRCGLGEVLVGMGVQVVSVIPMKVAAQRIRFNRESAHKWKQIGCFKI